MTAVERALLVARLEMAIGAMGGRYGITCMNIAYARPGSPEHGARHRAATRQYKALGRLARALADLADGGTR